MCTILYDMFSCEEGRLIHMSTISQVASKLLQGKALVDRAVLKFRLPLTVVMSSEPLFWECPVPGALLTLTPTAYK
jgi:hypothetical protein